MSQNPPVLKEASNLIIPQDTANFKLGPAATPFNPSPSTSPPSSSSSSIRSKNFEHDISSYDEFGVDSTNGFLPSEPPLERLEGEIPEIAKEWEYLLDQAQSIPLMLAGGGSQFEEEKKAEGKQWRRAIRGMRTLHIQTDSRLITDVRFSRRGHLVLSFLSHFYIHSQPPPAAKLRENFNRRSSQSWNPLSKFFSNQSSTSGPSSDEIPESEFSRKLPSSLAVPYQQLSKVLGIPPVLTYATTVLWNWTLIDSNLPLSASNVKMVTGFTGSKSEEHFYKTSLLMEIEGREAFGLMRESLFKCFESKTQSTREEKVEKLASNLKKLKTIIDELTKILHNVRSDCEPSEFYWGLRPWFRGADSGVPEKGWIFEGVKEEGENDWISEWTGPSAGQSSLIHSLDIFLDVDHTERKHRNIDKLQDDERKGTDIKKDATFMERMLLHMPREHRNYLKFLRSLSLSEDPNDDDDSFRPVMNQALSTDTSDPTSISGDKFPHHPIRSLALTSKKLSRSYDEALVALKNLRDEHMRIATLYIITQSRAQPPSKYAPLPINFTGNLASQLPSNNTTPPTSNDHIKPKLSRTRRYSKPGDGIAADALNSGAKGTGGTELTSFLRDCRNHTVETIIGE